MPEWSAPPKIAEITERRLLDAILDGSFPIDSKLPPERELAGMLGVTRPTLREALQRLSREGWLEIHHGKQTRVKNYWQEGNLLILNYLVHNLQAQPPLSFPTCWKSAPRSPRFSPVWLSQGSQTRFTPTSPKCRIYRIARSFLPQQTWNCSAC